MPVPASVGACAGIAGEGAAGAPAGDGLPVASALAAAASASMARVTSRSTIRPCGPLPVMPDASMPAWAINLRAIGEAKTRPSRASEALVLEAGAGSGSTIGNDGSSGTAGAVAGATVSPSAASTPIMRLTGTSTEPAGMAMLTSTPSTAASTSMVALSVSISARTSPARTGSPTAFSHWIRFPFSMVGDSAGMRMSIGIAVRVPGRRSNFSGSRRGEPHRRWHSGWGSLPVPACRYRAWAPPSRRAVRRGRRASRRRVH